MFLNILNRSKRYVELQEEIVKLKEEIQSIKRNVSTFPNGPSFPVTFNADGLATVHNSDFVHEQKFHEAYELGMQTGHRFGDELHVEWRVKVCCWAASCALKLDGDFVECGVNTGISSRAIMSYIAFEKHNNRKYYLLDTFSGIPQEQLIKEEVE